MKLIQLNALTCLLIMVTACTPTKNNESNFQNYNSFSIVQNIPVTTTCNNTCVQFKKEFRYVVYVGKQIYCYWDEKTKETQIDYDKLASDLESQITSTTTLQNYYLLLMNWASSFHDGHVNVLMGSVSPASFEFYEPNIRFELLHPGTDSEKLIISKIGDDVSILKVGTEVVSINGKPWKDIFQKAVALASGSSNRMRRMQASRRLLPLLVGQQDGFTDIQIEGLLTGDLVKENVSRGLSLDDGSAVAAGTVTGSDAIHAKILDGNVGYLRIDAFQGTKDKELLEQAMARLANVSSLLIDLRLNGGGDLSGNQIISYLTDHPVVRYSTKVRNSDMLLGLDPALSVEFNFLGDDWSELRANKVTNRSLNAFKGAVAVLTSARCFSACDTFVAALKENNLAKVIGEPTGGGTGSPKVIDLPVSNLQFRYSIQKGYNPVSGTLLEGTGTDVDFSILPTIEERVMQKDLQLQKAITYLKSIATVANPVVNNQAKPPQLIGTSAMESAKIQASPLEELNIDLELSGAESY